MTIFEWTWNFDSVRRYCINEELYTCGDAMEYERMLNYVRSIKNPTEIDVMCVAIDIFSHSNTEAFSCPEELALSMINSGIVCTVLKRG